MHNFLIDRSEKSPSPNAHDLSFIRAAAENDGGAVCLDKHNRPVALLNCADGVFADTGIQPNRLETDSLTMDEMIKQVEDQGLRRPLRRLRRR